MNVANEKNETGNLYPKLNITILPLSKYENRDDLNKVLVIGIRKSCKSTSGRWNSEKYLSHQVKKMQIINATKSTQIKVWNH